MPSSHWSRDAIALIRPDPARTIPAVERAGALPLLPGIDLWDLWPVQATDGTVADVAGSSLWMLLSAPAAIDPDARHAVARIRLMRRTGEVWTDLGKLLPDGFAPGSREWAGSAIIEGDRLTLYFTAAGQRGEAVISFAQRLFQTHATLHDGIPADWSPPVESVVNDGAIYTSDLEGGGRIGTIKAFRDPAWFRDPADGAEYLLFTGSLAASASDFNGAIGIARRTGGAWVAAPPIIDADGVNNELERPHIVMHAGRYHCFWSTQGKVFVPGIAAPNGLYGMVADRMAGPWRPLNGSGLVLANPPAAPFQNYSWLVTADLDVVSFLDLLELDHAPTSPEHARAHFGGTPAPVLRIAIDGDTTRRIGT